MSLSDTLQEDMKQALKARDELTLSTVRLVRSSVSYARIEKGDELTDDEVMGVISREAKKRREAIDLAERAERFEIVEREKAELEVLTRYLPAQLDETEIEAVARVLPKSAQWMLRIAARSWARL